jgi:hypothetical protein
VKTRMLVIAGLAGLVLVSLVVVRGIGLPAGASVFARSSPDPDAVALAALSQQSLGRASQVVVGPILRQVDVDPETGHLFFRYTDPAATVEVDVDVPTPNSSPDQWQVSATSHSKLVGFRAPAVNMAVLKVGPAAVARALASHWSGCTVGFVTLYVQDDHLAWTGFCTLRDGRIASGSTDNRTGEFQPSPAPPAYPPATAMPEQP